jgi:hypothetical protein
MKNLLLVATLMFATLPLCAQTIILPPSMSTLSYNGRTINFDDPSVFAPRKQTRFIFGWQWAGPIRAVNERLHVNYLQNHWCYNNFRNDMYTNQFPNNADTVYLVWSGLEAGGENFFGGIGLRFDPVANTYFDYANPTVPNDTTNAVFGFALRQFGTRGTDTNQDRYEWSTNASPTYPVTILDSPMVQNRYYIYADRDDPANVNSNGKKWVFAINLRRTDVTDTSMTNNDTLLSIELPFKDSDPNTNDNTLFIAFDSVSVGNQNQSIQLPLGRGRVLPLQSAVAGQKKFFITRRMLPPGNAVGINRDITIKATFSFKTESDLSNPNPKLQYYKEPSAVVQIGTRIQYVGKGNVSIDWVHIATPETENNLRGAMDSTFWVGTRKVMDTVIARSNAGKVARLVGFYGDDEPQEEQLMMLQYYNRLLGGRVTSKSIASNTINIVGTASEIRWADSRASIKRTYVTQPFAPFARYWYDALNSGDTATSNRTAKYFMGLDRGWGRNSLNNHLYDSLSGSTYETWLNVETGGGIYQNLKIRRQDTASMIHVSKQYLKVVGVDGNTGNKGTLNAIEEGIYTSYLNRSMLYDSIPWWEMTAFVIDWTHQYDPDLLNRKIFFGNVRPNTGEEVRHELMTNLMLGAKGLTYDRFYTSGRLSDTSQGGGINTGAMLSNDSTNFGGLTGDALINSDIAGPDFFPQSEPITNIPFYIDFDSVATYTGVKKNRIYWGLKSMRREVVKIHDFVYNNEALFMSLRLKSWLGKGYATYKSGDTTTFGRIINLNPDKIRLRQIGRMDIAGQPIYEDPDSTFFDVALHSIGNIPIDSQFVFFVQNRRTAPFLIRSDTLRNLTADVQPTFVTTNEFDSMLVVNPSLRYAQVGAREITIPFNYKHPDGKGRMLHIQQVTKDSATPGIDTLICRECPLVMKFQPGEGKMFKVTVKPIAPSYTIADSGSLETNSQRKVVSVPLFTGMAYNQPTYDTTKMVHHMVYHIMDTIIIRRNPPDTNLILPRRKVVYQRSDTMDVCTPKDGITPLNINNQQIVWERPQIISSTITKEYTRQHQCLDEIQYLNPDCAFPSLTVRVDSATGTEKVYVVYGCRGSDPTAPLTLNKFTVVECEFASSADSVHPIEHNQIIARIDSSVGEVVKPVIGSATRGNYIAYSDNHVIQTLYQHPNRTMRCVASNYTRHDSISWYKSNYYSGACNEKGVATNPTINTFTHLQDSYHDDVLSDGCTIAWQEKNDQCNSMTEDPIWRGDHIYLARLDPITLNGMQLLRGANDADVLTLSSDSRVVRMSRNTTIADNFINHTSPSIAQITKPAHDGIYNAIRVGWTAQNFTIAPGTTFNGIFTVSMWFERSLTQTIFNTTLRTRSWCPCEFKNPNLTVSRQSEGTAGYAENKDNYTLNANFASNSIMQFTFNRLGYSMTTPDGERVFTGRNAQLSAQPMYTQNNYWSRMRRVVNIRTADSVPEKWSIRSAHELLFKRDAEDDGYKIIPMQGYLTKNSFVYLYDNSTDPEVRAEDKWKKTMRIRDKNSEPPSPMVETNWHKVNSEFIMPILLCGNGFETMNLHVENRRTKAIATIVSKFKNAPNPHEPLRILLRLQNGGGDEYRLVMGQVGVVSQLVTDIFIGKSAEYSAKSASVEESTPIEVDLRETVELHDGNMLSVFPDPNSGQSMTVQVHPVLVRNSRGNFKVSLLNGIGQVIHNATVPVTATIRLDELNLPNGVYYIRCEYTTSDYELRMATTSVVVVR